VRGSEFYGIQNVFYAHAGLPGMGFFPFSVQHGWQHSSTKFEADGNPSAIWVWSERSKAEIGKYFALDKIRIVGSPYLYLPERLPCHRSKPEGALYILPHSSHLARVGFSQDDLQRLLRSIQEHNGHCDVLVYYLDATPELCALLHGSGARILMNGGLWSTNFLNNFRENIHNYQRLYYSSFGSAVLFARHEGLETVYTALDSAVVQSSNSYLNDLNKEVAFDHEGQGWDVALELGVQYKLSGNEMRRLILDGLSLSEVFMYQRKMLSTLKNRATDYWRHVLPAKRLISAYNNESN